MIVLTLNSTQRKKEDRGKLRIESGREKKKKIKMNSYRLNPKLIFKINDDFLMD